MYGIVQQFLRRNKRCIESERQKLETVLNKKRKKAKWHWNVEYSCF